MARAELLNLCSLYQSGCGEPGVAARQDGHEDRHHTFSTLSLVIEPELYRHFASRIIRRQWAEGIDALERADRRLVKRRHAARLLDPNVRRVAVACDIKRYINPFRLCDARIDFILQPVFGDLSLHGLHVPRKLAAEIAATSGESESALGAAGAHGVVFADRTTFAIGNLIGLGGSRLRLALSCGLDGCGFHFFSVLVGNR